MNRLRGLFERGFESREEGGVDGVFEERSLNFELDSGRNSESDTGVHCHCLGGHRFRLLPPMAPPHPAKVYVYAYILIASLKSAPVVLGARRRCVRAVLVESDHH
jgi:hypothetical protein